MTKDELFKLLDEPLLIMMIGNVGTGKSTIAELLKSKLDCTILSGDDLMKVGKVADKKMLFGYVYKEAEEILNNRRTVIIDGRNLIKRKRQIYSNLASRNKLKTLFIDCGIGTDVDLERRILNNRGVPKEEWKKEFAKNKEIYEKPESQDGNQFVIDKQTLYFLWGSVN